MAVDNLYIISCICMIQQNRFKYLYGSAGYQFAENVEWYIAVNNRQNPENPEYPIFRDPNNIKQEEQKNGSSKDSSLHNITRKGANINGHNNNKTPKLQHPTLIPTKLPTFTNKKFLK